MFSVRYKKILLIIAAVIMLGSVAIIAFFGVRFGIDFTGGTLIEVSYETAPTQNEVESAIAPMGLGGVSVRASEVESRPVYFIRTRTLSDPERQTLEDNVTTLGQGANVERLTTVGPVIGSELKDKAVWAIVGVSLVIILYVAYAFAGIGTPVGAPIYGLITIIVLIHDVLVPTAMMSVLGVTNGAEIDVLFVMAILAVLGYSVNDTIVIFDRVRENLKANRTEQRTKKIEPGGVEIETVTYTLTKPFAEIVGSAVTQSMGRSVNTSLTTFVTLLALFFIGGSLTQNFALVLMAGVLAGTYSSIFIASPLLLAYADWQERKMNKGA